MKNVFLFVFIGLLSLPTVISPVQASTPPTPMADSIAAYIEQQRLGKQGIALDWLRLRQFYAARKHNPIWIKPPAGLRGRAEKWYATLQNAEVEGLEAARYRLEAISRHWSLRTIPDLVKLELLLTDAFFRYSADVRFGHKDDPEWRIAASEEDVVKRLQRILTRKNFDAALKRLPPPHRGYRDLRRVLAHYRQLTRQGDWPTLPEMRLYWGMWHDNIALLRQQLIMTGDLAAIKVQEPRFFDENLTQAVQRFQHRHGVKADGIVGTRTHVYLNQAPQQRIEQIKRNMERWRWLPRKLGQRYIMVNIAGQKLFVFEHDKPRLAMRIVAGQQVHPTPIFASSFSKVIINPYWNAPRRIAVENLIPKQIRNSRFLSANKIRVLTSFKDDAEEVNPASINWSDFNADNMPYVFRQDPGPYNSLGRIKIPLKDNSLIYLHDTPQTHLFDIATRTFSSGCVRLEEPRQLADYLLSREQGWDLKKLNELIDSGETLKVPLQQPFPIYLVYFTAWVGSDKAIYFHKDIYERDSMNQENGPSPKATQGM